MSSKLIARYYGNDRAMIKIYYNGKLKPSQKQEKPYELMTDDKLDIVIENKYKFTARFERIE